MKKISTLTLVTLVALPACIGNAGAASGEPNSSARFPHGIQLGVGISATSGLNGFVGYANKNFESFWWKRLGVRFDFATTSPVKSSINSAIDSALEDGVDLGDEMTLGGGKLSAKHMAALVDFYPFGNTWFLGGWRLTAGYALGQLNGAATLTGALADAASQSFEFEINYQNYRYTGGDVTATADVNWKYSGPYLGTGFDLGLFWGFKIYMDAGVVFTSKTAALDLNAPINDMLEYWNGTNWIAVEGNSGLEGLFESAKDVALKDANDTLRDLKFFPMVKLGFMYRF